MSEYQAIDRAKAAFARAGWAWPTRTQVQMEAPTDAYIPSSWMDEFVDRMEEQASE